mgnify:CR=1 FL=1
MKLTEHELFSLSENFYILCIYAINIIRTSLYRPK